MKTAFLLLTTCIAMTVAGCGSNSDKTTETTTTADTTAATAAIVEPTAQPAQPPPMDSAAMAKAWMEYATPGDMHKWMASTDGTWTGEVKSWMAPDAPPKTDPVTIVNKTVLGGRYQQSTYKSTMDGQPFEGIGTLAYNNGKKKWMNTWIDNMGTGMVVMEGDLDQASKTMKMEGKMTDPMTGKDCKLRQVITFVDDKTQKFEMYSDRPGGGGEMKVMEMMLTKK